MTDSEALIPTIEPEIQAYEDQADDEAHAEPEQEHIPGQAPSREQLQESLLEHYLTIRRCEREIKAYQADCKELREQITEAKEGADHICSLLKAGQ